MQDIFQRWFMLDRKTLAIALPIAGVKIHPRILPGSNIYKNEKVLLQSSMYKKFIFSFSGKPSVR